MKTHSPKLLGALVSRHLKMFFKNKMTFFFSLLVPCITLAIYFLFLRELEVSAVTGVIGGLNLQDPDPLINASYRLIDSWMLSGILAVSCISVSFNACYIIISDREKGVNREFLAAPVSKSLISFSYFVFNCIVTLIIVSAVLFICLGYLGASGNFRLTFANFGYIYLVIILSVISAATISAFRRIVIGDHTLIGGNVLITDSDWHPLDPAMRRIPFAEGRCADVVIGSNVFIGTRSIILKGVTIGDNSVIGAGSVVTRDIPANVIAAGNPCVVVKHL